MSIKKISAVLLSLVFFHSLQSRHIRARTFTIMINPAGDAKNTGRRIEDSFERGITMQCAEQLKQLLEQRGISVILTRTPGEIVYPLQNANFANRLKVNLYISLHFYHEKETRPHVYLYQFSYNDTFITKSFDLAFIPYDKAHVTEFQKTTLWANQVKNVLSDYTKYFTVHGVHQLPFAPFIGIQAPAIGFEMGIKEKTDWKNYIEPLANSIETLVHQEHTS